MLNMFTVLDQIRMLPDAALQRVAQSNADNAAIVAAVMSEVSRRQKVRQAGMGQGAPVATVRDQMFSGLAAAPANLGMAGGGIVAFAGGGSTVPLMPPDTADLFPILGIPRKSHTPDWSSVERRIQSEYTTGPALPRSLPVTPSRRPEVRSPDVVITPAANAPAMPAPSAPDTEMYSSVSIPTVSAAPIAMPELQARKFAEEGGEQLRKQTEAAYGPQARAQYMEGMPKPEDVQKEREQVLRDSLKRSGVARVDAKNMAFLQAGLAIMAGDSPHALKNIGEGGLKALSAYKDELAMIKASEEQRREGIAMIEEARRQQAANNAQAARAFDAQGRQALLAADATRFEAVSRAVGNEDALRVNAAIHSAANAARAATMRASLGAMTMGARMQQARLKTLTDQIVAKEKLLPTMLDPRQRAQAEAELAVLRQQYNAVAGFGGLPTTASGLGATVPDLPVDMIGE